MCYDYLGRRSVLFGYCIELNEIVDIKKCLYYEEKRWHNTRSKREGSESKATNSEDGESEDYDSEDYEFDHEEGLDSDQKYLIEKRLNEAWEKFIKNNQALFERFPINGLGFTIFYQARSASYECAPIDDAKLIWGYDLDNVKIDKEQKDESASIATENCDNFDRFTIKMDFPKKSLDIYAGFLESYGTLGNSKEYYRNNLKIGIFKEIDQV